MYVALCVGMGSCQLCDCDSRTLSLGNPCDVWSDYSRGQQWPHLFPETLGLGRIPHSPLISIPCVWWGLGADGWPLTWPVWATRKTWCLTVTFSSPASTLLRARRRREGKNAWWTSTSNVQGVCGVSSLLSFFWKLMLNKDRSLSFPHWRKDSWARY